MPRPENGGRLFRDLTGAVASVAVSPDGTSIAVGSRVRRHPRAEARLTVWEATERPAALVGRRAEPTWPVSVALAPDGKSVAVGYGDYLGFFNGDRAGQVLGGRAAERDGFAGLPRAAATSRLPFPDGRRVAVAGTGVVEIWDPAQGPRCATSRATTAGSSGWPSAPTEVAGHRRVGPDGQALGRRHRAEAADDLRPRWVRPRPGLQPRRPTTRHGE